jgi:hypothetical protein
VQSVLAERYARTHGLAVSAAEVAAYWRLRDAGPKTDRSRPPERPSAEDVRARETIARAFIQQWKINRSLYERYGGRIVRQQGGPEPLDAWRRFLEDSQSRGEFRLMESAQADAFWGYFRDDARHDFYPAGSVEEAEALRLAPWDAR